MKKLLFLLLLIPFLGNSQATFTAPVGYNTGAPTATPSGVGTRWRFDLLTGKKYTWLPGSLSWDEDARGIDQVAGCSAPLYTPGYNQSTFAVNSCSPPVLYQWTGAAWEIPNESEIYTAGTGISIDGSNVITNTSPNVVQTLSIAGQDLTLSGGGGTVAIPADGNGIYGGSGTVIDEGVAKTRLFRFKTDDDPTYNTDGFFSEMVFGGIYSMSTGAFAELPGFNTIVAGTPGASNVFATFNFDGEQGLIDIKSSDGGGGIAGIAVGSAFVSINTIPTTGGNFAMTYDFNGAIFSDQRTVTKGIEYFDDYSADFTERSLIDKEYADTHSGSALGTGFVDGGGAGTIPAGTVAETGLSSFIYGYDSNPDAIAWQWDNTTGNYQRIINNGDGLDIGSFDDNNASSMRMVLSGGTGNFAAVNGTLEFTAKSNGVISFDQQECFLRFSSLANTVAFEDTRATPTGIEYLSDYSATIITNPRSIPDVGTVDLLKQTPVSYDNASAPNNCIFYSTTLSKLAYKDPGGTVNPLY